MCLFAQVVFNQQHNRAAGRPCPRATGVVDEGWAVVFFRILHAGDFPWPCPVHTADKSLSLLWYRNVPHGVSKTKASVRTSLGSGGSGSVAADSSSGSTGGTGEAGSGGGSPSTPLPPPSNSENVALNCGGQFVLIISNATNAPCILHA